MFGIVRPCRHRLSEGLRNQWMAHLCGLCLALRQDHGQFARVATNYDGLLISVLTEAQSAPAAGARRLAGPCPLRGMRTASVARGEGARLAAAVSLVLASAKVRDHVADGDGLLARRPVALAARRIAANWGRAGARGGHEVGFDTALLLDAVERQAGIEALAGPGTPLLTVTEPTETATAAAFAHTALLAGRPANAEPLAEAGRLFGRLAHLLDAVEDQVEDAATGAWNPLTATGTSTAEARRLAEDALHGIRLALREVEFTEPALAHLLLVHELPRSVDRAFGTESCGHDGHDGDAGRAAGAGPVRGAFGPPQPPYGAPQQPYGPPQSPYGPPFGPPEPPRPPEKRGWLAGCAVATGLCCTCRVCCADEYEGPWSRKKREGCLSNCDCDCCDACDCCDCCDCCSCCDC
ncbi:MULTISPECIES: DUF5685 family protein [Streptomyces]|uniref:Cysteine-rich transmembrane CYSTM domain-containing protein n=2 Tax=Streptomyces griseoaurantiacus TaxID=68213 RepID=A0A7W2DQT7_9ACTN|nr:MULTISPECIES: DUF5685 family protein [Streptomyces]MBA5221292.1 hypothetical protein [Streptomyces griseoaurantiacus]MDX3088012.1 DUF5685 family protein [Streptomyces sp. ME12-02E]MDX3331369.1 DUF5685 family protein [Streptomyces sp. ME02-6978a]MDX3360287.1 DUF5685 family protein [Streptomyces sp. ME02-6978.2a]